MILTCQRLLVYTTGNYRRWAMTTNPREQRGLAIAATCKLSHQKDYWVVPSQTGQGKYYVRPNREQPSCTCSDHQEFGCKCKHIFAVEFVIQRELFSDRT